MMNAKRHHVIVLLAAAALALVAGLWAGRLANNGDGPGGRVDLQGGTSMLTQPRPLPEFELQSHRGEPFTRTDLKGQWSLLFFGYTHCPDVCPMTLSMLNNAKDALASQGGTEDTQVVFISVDPERDTREVLQEYVTYFDPAFTGVRGPEKELERLTKGLGILYSKVSNPDKDGEYLVDHSASIIVVGPAAQQVAVLSAPHKAETVAHDLQRLRQAYPGG